MLTILGCGNSNRSDDGVGVAVARRLAERLRRHPVPGVRAFDLGTGGMEVMFAARGSTALLVLDACTTGAEAGAIYQVPGEELARERQPGLSLHGFRWDDALAVGRKLFREAFPAEVQVWLVEAQSTALGLELTPLVQRAAEALYQRALERIASFAAARGAGASLELQVSRGSIHLPRQVVEEFFAASDGALVSASGHQLRLLPLQPAMGGALLKQRSREGDRVIDAAAVLRENGWDEWGDYACPARWDPESGALALAMPPQRNA
jgi:hydrogenase maturation protease